MGREVLRVPLDFDWPIGMLWPGKMLGVCGEMEYVVKEEKYKGERCDMCKKWARLAGIQNDDSCPSLPYHDPPHGDAYQLWSTTTEGHPMSPPFATTQELAKWLYENEVSSFGYQTENYETWLNFINGPGWAPTGMFSPSTGMISGVAAGAALDNKEENQNNNQQSIPATATPSG